MLTETHFDGFRCVICGEFHAGQYISIGMDCPDPYAALDDTRKESAFLGTDDCVIEDEYYLRGVIELPIVELNEPFLWSVWARIWQEDYEDFADHYHDEGREKATGPYKGRLGNKLIGHYDPETLNLKCTIKVQPVGVRPLFIIDEADHPLAIEQRNGITLQRAQQISSLVYHQG